MEVILHSPFRKETLSQLRAGDRVLLSGTIYTARDAAHLRICELLSKGEEPPFPLKDCAIYYVGPTPEAPGQVIGSAGPTTSGRMDKYSPMLLNAGETVMIGKGDRNEAVRKAMKENGAVYLAAMGGAGALMGDCIRSCEIVCWEDLGCEAVRRLTVENMPLLVAIDAQGNDLYELGPRSYLEHTEGK